MAGAPLDKAYGLITPPVPLCLMRQTNEIDALTAINAWVTGQGIVGIDKVNITNATRCLHQCWKEMPKKCYKIVFQITEGGVQPELYEEMVTTPELITYPQLTRGPT